MIEPAYAPACRDLEGRKASEGKGEEGLILC